MSSLPNELDQSATDETEFLAELATVVGQAGLLIGQDTASYSTDWRKLYRGTPLAVVRPATTEEVAGVVNVCAAHSVAIVPQGGNTGLSGGAAPYEDRANIVLSTQRMRSIHAVDADCFTITAEAGATIQELQEAARSQGCELSVDWGARGTATLGGAIATDAGGINVLRSGTMRDQVLGLEVVLADGQTWDGLRALRKDASGYGLKHLFIGSEGTLGVVTKAVLKLEPSRVHQQSFLAAVTDFDRLPELYALALHQLHDDLDAFELIPERGLRAVCEHVSGASRPLTTVADWYVLGRATSSSNTSDAIADLLLQASESGLISDAAVASSASQETNLWLLREELPPEALLGIRGAKFDVAVPINKVAEFFGEAQRLVHALDDSLEAYAFGHLGDGNLHLYFFADVATPHVVSPNAVPPNAVPREMPSDLRRKIVNQIDELTWRYGGTISAEHGVGQYLRDRMRGQKSDVELGLLANVKATIDPQNLFNPGRGSHSA